MRSIPLFLEAIRWYDESFEVGCQLFTLFHPDPIHMGGDQGSCPQCQRTASQKEENERAACSCIIRSCALGPTVLASEYETPFTPIIDKITT